jgi:60 kDa SS-A/Ro ribonucleoprotein
MTALTEYVKTEIPQSQQADPAQVKNHAGGYTFKVSDLDAFKRFLILGTEGGTFYVSQRKQTLDSVDSMTRLFETDGILAVDTIVEISKGGRAIKNDQAIFALAYAASVDDDNVRRYALAHLNDVCRIGTHLFQFAEYVQKFRGWGRGLRNAVGDWYLSKDNDQLAYQVVKYRQRDGWSHRDLLRLAHPKLDNEMEGVARFASSSDLDSLELTDNSPEIIRAFMRLRKVKTVDQVVKLINEFPAISHEMIPTEFKGDPAVWSALLERRMPMTALIRNLGTMSANGTLKPLSSNAKLVASQLSSGVAIRNARVHPMTILFALKTYQSGGGWRSSKNWTPVSDVVDALNSAFYLAFDNIEPANKNTLVALDVSGSMTSHIAGTNLSCRDASGAMAMVTVRTEPSVHTIGFTGGGWGWGGRSSTVDIDGSISEIALSKSDNLNGVIEKISDLPFGGTDCALPMLYAEKHGLEVDTFIVYTDNETWAGDVHPHVALKNYRRSSGRDAKLVVVGMATNDLTIADPKDRGMLDVVGMDTSVPTIVNNFSAGRF